MTQAYNLSQLANNLNSAGQLDATDGLVNAVPVANGGTGASTTAAARSNLNVPTRTGGDASGTWAINISGNASTATNATNAENAANATVAASCSGNSATVTNGVYTTNFTGSNQSLTSNGKQNLPGGLILQWFEVTTTSSSLDTNYSFPTPFPNACLNITATWYKSDNNFGNSAWALGTFNSSTFRIALFGSANQTFKVFAIGY